MFQSEQNVENMERNTRKCKGSNCLRTNSESGKSSKQTWMHVLTLSVAPSLALLHFLSEWRRSFIPRPEKQKPQEQNVLQVAFRQQLLSLAGRQLDLFHLAGDTWACNTDPDTCYTTPHSRGEICACGWAKAEVEEEKGRRPLRLWIESMSINLQKALFTACLNFVVLFN